MKRRLQGEVDWEKLWLELEPLIKNLIKTRLYFITPHQVEDICQDIWLRAYSNRNQLRVGKNIKGYVYRLTMNHLTDLIRKYYRTTGFSELPLGEAIQIDREDLSLNSILGLLPKEDQTIIQLNFLEGYSQREIAKRLEIPIGSMSGKLKHSLQKMHIQLKKENLLPEDFTGE